VPNSQGYQNYAVPRELSISVAIDSMGRPAVAYLEAPETGYNTVLNYWRSDMADSVKVTDTNNAQNDFATVSLAFVGTKPRVAALLSTDLSTYGMTYVSSPDDGTTWNTAVPLIQTENAYPFSTLAASATSDVVATHYNGSASAAAEDAGCSTDPVVVRTSNSGANFTGCTVPGGERNMNGALSSAFGASRINGKYVLVGHSKSSLADAGSGSGIIYYQDP